MWIPKKQVNGLEKKVAELEHEVQIQREVISKHLSDHAHENAELKAIIKRIKREALYNGTAQTS